MVKINIDCEKTTGKIKPMHAVNNVQSVPLDPYGGLDRLAEANVPFSHLHDTGYYTSIPRLVDIKDVFPHFDADENDPNSYDFSFTDVLLSAMVEKRHQALLSSRRNN